MGQNFVLQYHILYPEEKEESENGLDTESTGSYNQCMTERIHVQADKKYCINCDNRHGCKSGTPPCIGEMTKNNVTGQAGKDYLVEERKIRRCKDCTFFRSCWTEEEYGRMMCKI